MVLWAVVGFPWWVGMAVAWMMGQMGRMGRMANSW